MEEGPTPHEDDATFSAELVQEGVRILQKILNQQCSRRRSSPCCRWWCEHPQAVIAQQKAAADVMLAGEIGANGLRRLSTPRTRLACGSRYL